MSQQVRLSVFLCVLITSLFSIQANAGWFERFFSPTYAKTKHPIVMVPGAFAFDNAFGILDYWHGITEELRSEGAEVYVVNLSSLALHETRGEELLADIESILAITGAEKVNIIAHSQGATASRYVASLRPDMIASVSCTHCMNEGTHFATNVVEVIEEGTLLHTIGTGLVDVLFDFIEVHSTDPSDGDFNSEYRGEQSSVALLEAASLADYDRFNALFPEAMPHTDCSQIDNGTSGNRGGGDAVVNGIHYFSWGGNRVINNVVDPLDAILVPLIGLFMPQGTIWDGLVPGCGQALGKLLRDDYPTNHYDAINQTAGITPWYVNVPSIFVTQANRLKKLGL